MEDLKTQIKEKAAVSEEQAALAVEVVSVYLKERLPVVMHYQLDRIFEGQKLEESIRSKVEEIGSELKNRTEILAKDLKTAFEGAFSSKKE